MMLQNMCAEMGGKTEPVLRKRKAQWKPKTLVYANWNTKELSGYSMEDAVTRKGKRTAGDDCAFGSGSGAPVAVECVPCVMDVGCEEGGGIYEWELSTITLTRLTCAEREGAEEDHA
jgi:hypothetical protein